MTPAEASLRGRMAAHLRWAHCPDRAAATAKARAAFQTRFEREVDPDGTLAPAERAKRATNAKAAYYAKLALQRHRTRTGT